MDNEIYEKMVENLKNHPERFGRQHYFKIEDGKIHEYSIISVMPYHCGTRLKWHLMDSSGIVEDDISIDEYCKSVFLRMEDAEAEMSAVKEYFGMMWENVKNDFDCSSFLKQARGHALFLIQESIQLAAMLQKALDSQEESL